MQFDERHLNWLVGSEHIPQGPVGSAPQAWAQHLDTLYPDPSTLSGAKLTRDQVREECRKATSLETCFATCMAWGAMRRDHGRRAWGAREAWLPVLEELRSSNLSRSDAYQRFADLRAAGRLRGMRPAYFTKLIFFLRPNTEDVGYIMDQWTARSINLLTGQDVVRLNNLHLVTDKNKAADYEAFCRAVDDLSKVLGTDGPTTEERLFSVGRGKGRWRGYVISQRDRTDHMMWAPGDLQKVEWPPKAS